MKGKFSFNSLQNAVELTMNMSSSLSYDIVLKMLLITFVLLLSSLNLSAQKHFNNWYFGGKAGLTFNTRKGEPEAVVDGQLVSIEGCSSISDNNGNLLFYTNGVTIWNKKHEIMKNGHELFGHSSTSQSALIVPKPGNNNFYYVFTLFHSSSREQSKGFNYSVVDISLDSNKGEVVDKNIPILEWTTERMAGVGHKNQIDIWVIVQDKIEECFKSYLISESGISNQPVRSNFVTDIDIYNGAALRHQTGIMKISPSGEKIAVTTNNGDIFLYDFDTETGIISNEVNIKEDVGFYGLEFSDYNNYLYVSASKRIINSFSSFSQILQFDISNFDSTTIHQSKKYIFDQQENESMYALQMGPNKKIYISQYSQKKLSVIENPNLSFNECGFKYNVIDLNDKLTFCGLPSVVQNYTPKLFKSEKRIISVCESENIDFPSDYYDNATYQWIDPFGNVTNKQNYYIHNSKIEMSGTYVCKIFIEKKLIEIITVNLTVNPRERIKFSDLSFVAVCDDSYELIVLDEPENCTFKWNGLNSNENKVIIKQSGIYSVIVENEFGCIDSASIEILLNQKPEFQIFNANNNLFCEGESIELWVDSNFANYLWSTGDTTSSITVSNGGIYFVKVINEFGCEGVDSINITEVVKPKIEFDNYFYTLCYGESLILKPNNTNPNFSYLWSTGETTESITVSYSGTYKLIITNNNLCSDTAEIEVKIYPDLALDLLADKTNLCFDDSTTIYTANTYSEYLWSTGETTPVITVKEAGIYELIVKNEFGCADTAEIKIFKYDSNIEFDNEKLIFDELCVGDSQEIKINLKLVSGEEFKISNITADSQYFEIQSTRDILKNGESAEITVTFKPQDAGIFEDELVISSTEPCEFSKSIPISASAKQVFEFSFGEHYSTAGQSLGIPLLGQIKCPEPQNLTTDYEIEVTFDKEYFSPESVKFGQLISNEIVGNERVIKIKADGDFLQTKSEINAIYGRALLGRSESSQIRIEVVKLSKDRYFPEYLNGSLNVDGCVNDISQILSFTPTKMTISPNPSDGELKVSIGTQEQGSFSLVVFDIQGREVYRTEFTKPDKTFEQKDYNINTLQLGNGIYTIHLTAPWTLLREQIVVVR